MPREMWKEIFKFLISEEDEYSYIQIVIFIWK
jgi:hypothetical protein